jgi:predicted GIY-YIG superfamily endonuclease
MPIDGCTSTFAGLAADILPSYMKSVRSALTQARPLTEFCAPGVGARTLLKRLARTKDFSGCYVLVREGKPFYVGISRSVVARLLQHGKGKTHFDASLAYRMACEKVDHNMTREEAMKDTAFREAFNDAQRLLRGSSVAFVEITNPLELYGILRHGARYGGMEYVPHPVAFLNYGPASVVSRS